jgi:hypothetical protein
MKWNGRNYKPLLPQKIRFKEEKFDVEEYMKSLQEKHDRVPVWRTIPNPIAVNVPVSEPVPPPAFDADAAAFLNQVLVSGGTLDATISGATNTLFTELKSQGIYNKMFALYPLVGGVAASHAINAANLSSYTITWVGGITHNSDGVMGNGISGYGDTQWIQNNETTTGNTAVGFYMVASGNTAFDFGRQYVGGFVALNNYQLSTNLRGGMNTNLLNYQTGMSGETGFYGISRNNGTQVLHISPFTSGTVTSNQGATLATGSLGLMTAFGFGTASSKTYGTFVIAEGLTLTELQNLSLIITTFNNTIGR